MNRAMKRPIEVGIRHLALAPVARSELRTIAASREREAPVTVSAAITRLIWAVFVGDHVEKHKTTPNREDCANYRLLAEYVTGDAIDSIDRKLIHCLTKPLDGDPLLSEARALKQLTDRAMQEEAARADIEVEEMLVHAHRVMREAR